MQSQGERPVKAFWQLCSNFCLGTLVAISAGQAFGQAADNSRPAAGEAETQSRQADEEVVVRGLRLSEVEFDLPEYVREFVAEVAAVPMGAGFARWKRSVCVGVNNLEPTAAQYIADRVSILAAEVGLEPGEPGCTPNVVIIFAVNAKDLAGQLVENEPRFFRPTMGECCTQLGLAALDEFAESDNAVRWWHVSAPVSAMTGQIAMAGPTSAAFEYPTFSVAGPSRIHNGIVDVLQHALILVDASKLSGKSWQQIGDYLAVISLAQIDLNTDPAGFDSILNLFTNGAAYSGLTDWDRSFVQSLYDIDLERLPQLQRNQLVARIAKQERSQSD
jgi:hypothetical protein